MGAPAVASGHAATFAAFAVNVLTFAGSIVSSISTPLCRPVGSVSAAVAVLLG